MASMIVANVLLALPDVISSGITYYINDICYDTLLYHIMFIWYHYCILYYIILYYIISYYIRWRDNVRVWACHIYAYAVPGEAALAALLEHSPTVISISITVSMFC